MPEEIARGDFRQDLFYRLNVITIQLPPLSERNGDALLLAMHFLARKSREMSKDIREIEKEAADLLAQYSWHGHRPGFPVAQDEALRPGVSATAWNIGAEQLRRIGSVSRERGTIGS